MAGLFALLYGTFILGSNIVDAAKSDSYTEFSKKDAIREGKMTYYDGNHKMRFIENDILCDYGYSKDGHFVLKQVNNNGIPNGIILYDFSKIEEEEENKQLQKLIETETKKGNSYFNYYFDINPEKYKSLPKGYYFGYDIENKKRFMIKKTILVGKYLLVYYKNEKTYDLESGKSYYVEDKTIEPIIISQEEYEKRGGK